MVRYMKVSEIKEGLLPLDRGVWKRITERNSVQGSARCRGGRINTKLRSMEEDHRGLKKSMEVLDIEERSALDQAMWERIIASLTPSLGEDGL